MQQSERSLIPESHFLLLKIFTQIASLFWCECVCVWKNAINFAIKINGCLSICFNQSKKRVNKRWRKKNSFRSFKVFALIVYACVNGDQGMIIKFKKQRRKALNLFTPCDSKSKKFFTRLRKLMKINEREMIFSLLLPTEKSLLFVVIIALLLFKNEKSMHVNIS